MESMFSDAKNVNKGKDFVGRAHNARQIRAEEKKRAQSAVKIQVLSCQINSCCLSSFILLSF